MSGKGSNNQSGSSGSKSSSSSGGGGSSSSSGSSSEPTVVSGHQYHNYSSQNRYAYIGKDDDGTPEFLDHGRKGGH
jgi:hypothetical protein